MITPVPTPTQNYNIFNAPFWEPLGVIGSLVLGITTIVLTFKLKKRKAISYQILSDTLVTSIKKEVEKDIEILYKGKKAKDVRLVILKIWNSGNVPIVSKDYEKPITFINSELIDNQKILYVDITKTLPENLGIKIVWDPAHKSIGFDKVLLNENDSVTVQLLLSDYKDKISVEGRLVGGTIKEIKFDKKQRLRMIDSLIAFLIPILALLVFYVLIHSITSILTTSLVHSIGKTTP